MATSTAGLLALTGVLATASPAAAGPNACESRDNNTIDKLLECVTVEGVREHQAAFQAIAAANDGTRASGTAGYDASAAYVQQRLEASGYQVQRQTFDFPYYELRSDPTLSIDGTKLTYPDDFRDMTYSGAGDVTGVIVPIDTAGGTSGCEAADFVPASATDQQVALIKRGTCTFGVKAANAEAAGYDAVIIFNDGAAADRFGVVAGTLGGPVGIPALGTSNALGLTLAGKTADISVDAISEVRTTLNLTADLRGRTPEVLAVGGHLDSVAEGAGINDNGSGSAAILEVAENLRKTTPEKTVRFAWWGAEELGLVGSTHYVANLPEEELALITGYLNFDMVGSPNFARFIYDSDGSTFPAPEGYVTPESAAIEATFEAFYDSRGLAYEDTEFDGRSDYQAFADAGIPSGGLFTGAEDVKTADQQLRYGGVVGQAFDPCYHAACDDLDNVSLEVLDQNSDAIAYATLMLAGAR